MIHGSTASMMGGGVVDTLAFYAPLTSSLTLDTGTASPTFTRATTATVADWEDKVTPVLSGESRFQGARRVENHVNGSSEDITNAAWLVTGSASKTNADTITFTAINEVFYQNIGMSLGAGDSVVMSFEAKLGTATGPTYQIAANITSITPDNITITSVWQRFSFQITFTDSRTAQFRLVNKNATGHGSVNIRNMQYELTTGQSNQNPGEYVSVGVGTESTSMVGADFTDSAYWTEGSGWAVSGGTMSLSSAGHYSTNYYSGTLSDAEFRVGVAYKITVTISNWTVGTLQWSFGTGTSYLALGGANGTFTSEPITYQGDRFIFRTSGSGSTYDVTNLVIEECSHGANVDGVKYFNTENGNTVASNVVTEATGSDLTTQDGYLNEEQRTNNCIYSADLSNAAWVQDGGVVVATNVATAPDGTTTADTLQDTGTGYMYVVQTVSIPANTSTYVYSIFIKKTGVVTPRVGIGLDLGTPRSDWTFNTNDATLTARSITTAGAFSGVEDFSTDWWRVYVGIANDGSGTSADLFINPAIADSDTATWISGSSGTNTFWGAQFETGSFPTSYIPTTTAAVTRNADSLTYNYEPPALVGSLLATLSIKQTTGQYLWSTTGSSLWLRGVGSLRSYDSGGVLVIQNPFSVDTEYKVGVTWEDAASPEWAGYSNGSQTNTGALGVSGYITSGNPLGILCRGDSPSTVSCGLIREVKFYTIALSQVEMEAATT